MIIYIFNPWSPRQIGGFNFIVVITSSVNTTQHTVYYKILSPVRCDITSSKMFIRRQKWTSVVILEVLLCSAYMFVVETDGYCETQPLGYEELRQILIGRCEEYQRVLHPEFNCTFGWDYSSMKSPLTLSTVVHLEINYRIVQDNGLTELNTMYSKTLNGLKWS